MKLLPVKLWESLPIGLYGILCASSWVRLRQERKTVWQHQRSSVLLSQQHAAQRKQSSSCLSSVGKATEPVFLNKLKALKRENLLFFSFFIPAARCWSLQSPVCDRCRPVEAGGRCRVRLETLKLSYIAQIPPAWWQQPAAAEWEETPRRQPQTVTSPRFRFDCQNKTLAGTCSIWGMWTAKIKQLPCSSCSRTLKSMHKYSNIYSIVPTS